MSALISILRSATGLSEHDLRTIIANAPVRYKNYLIEKRSGGMRSISQPAKEVKALQYALISEILNALPVHASATAYRPGLSIFHNADRHVKNGPIKKFDFKNFFPSIKATDWRAYCEKNGVFKDEEDIWISSQIMFHRLKRGHILRLAIGAPSSPQLSNVLMYDFDKAICDAVAQDKITYTRYADDLTFSAKRLGNLTNVEKNLRKVIRNVSSPALIINENKTVSVTMRYRRVVTGLVLSNDHTVSIGHERKRKIRAAVHHAQHGKLAQDEMEQLAGLLAFAKDVEPEFLERLKAYYGEEVIEKIKASVTR